MYTHIVTGTAVHTVHIYAQRAHAHMHARAHAHTHTHISVSRIRHIGSKL